MSIINFADLAGIRSKHKDKKIVFCSGTFDLTHAGHVLFFEDCREYGDIIVVAVGSDFNAKLFSKGKGRPVQNEHVRLKMVSSLKPVDYAFIDPNAENNNWFPLLKVFFEKLKPDYYIINKDASDIVLRENIVRDYPVKMVILDRVAPKEFDGISTTKMINKIKNEVEK